MRIILGQFDQHMAAKVFCCVSKTLILSRVSLGKFTKLFLGLILKGWSVSEVLGLESRLLDAQNVIVSALSCFQGAKTPGLKTVHLRRTKDLNLPNPPSNLTHCRGPAR